MVCKEEDVRRLEENKECFILDFDLDSPYLKKNSLDNDTSDISIVYEKCQVNTTLSLYKTSHCITTIAINTTCCPLSIAQLVQCIAICRGRSSNLGHPTYSPYKVNSSH